MTNWLRDKACIVGIGTTPYGKRGTLADIGALRLALDAIHAAAADAGLDVADIDGFTSFCEDGSTHPPFELTMALPTKKLRWSTIVWGGGGSGLPTAVTEAALAVATGQADYVAVVRSITQGKVRMGGSWADWYPDGLPQHNAHAIPMGFVVAPAIYAMRARRHMAIHGTTSEHLAAVAMHARAMAANNPEALFREPLTVETHQASRIIADPLRMFDCCVETDGAAALIITTPERARDLKQKPAFITGTSTASIPRWSTPITYAEDTDMLGTCGHAAAAAELYGKTGIGPGDIDVALLYDGTTAGLLLVLEDWGFCGRGEAGPMVASGGIGLGGHIPVNTHGGNLAEVYLQGANHLVEAVRQLRGTSHNQVKDAEVALYSSGVGYPPLGGILLHR
ncbi:MAG: lipid-transfer protein [Caulobacter sp.]|nr:lipid-transfer protein [Caulobacter sp.]